MVASLRCPWASVVLTVLLQGTCDGCPPAHRPKSMELLVTAHAFLPLSKPQSWDPRKPSWQDWVDSATHCLSPFRIRVGSGRPEIPPHPGPSGGGGPHPEPACCRLPWLWPWQPGSRCLELAVETRGWGLGSEGAPLSFQVLLAWGGSTPPHQLPAAPPHVLTQLPSGFWIGQASRQATGLMATKATWAGDKGPLTPPH